MFTFIFPVGSGAIPIVATIFLFSIALSVTLSPVVYQLLEKVQAVLVVIILAFIALAIFIATDLSAWTGVVTEAPQGSRQSSHVLEGDRGYLHLGGSILRGGRRRQQPLPEQLRQG